MGNLLSNIYTVFYYATLITLLRWNNWPVNWFACQRLSDVQTCISVSCRRGHEELWPRNLLYEVGREAFLSRSIKTLKVRHMTISVKLCSTQIKILLFFFFFLSRNGLLQRYSSSIYFLNALLATTGKGYLSNYHFYIVSLHLNFVEINANLLNLTTDLCMCTYVCAWETGKEEGSPILLVKYQKKKFMKYATREIFLKDDSIWKIFLK